MDNLSQIMEENLLKVWSERDSSLRLNAIQDIYAENGSLFEFGEETSGFDAINEHVTKLYDSIPPDFVFTQLKPADINGKIGRLVWGVGPRGHDAVQTGMDIAHIENGRIKSLYVFLDKQENGHG